MQTLKFGDDDEVLNLINLIRSEALPEDIAGCLRQSIQSLQDRGILRPLAVDETDIMSLGLQALFSHRAGKPGPKQSPGKALSSIKNYPFTESQALWSRPEPFNDKDCSTPFSELSQHGAETETDDCLLSSLNSETSLMSSLTLLESMSLPSEDMNQSFSGVLSYTTTKDTFPHNRDTACNHAELQYLMSYHSHPLNEPGTLRQWSSGHSATGPIAPRLTVKEHIISSNVCTSRQLNDFQRMEHELSARHRVP